MTIEQNRAIARRWMNELWQKNNKAAFDELLAPDFTFNYAAPGVTSDREGYKQTVNGVHIGFPSIDFTTEEMIAEGDKVVAYWKGRGVHKGEFWGVAPTGKQVTMEGISIIEIGNGKIVKEVGHMNALDVLQGIGAF